MTPERLVAEDATPFAPDSAERLHATRIPV